MQLQAGGAHVFSLYYRGGCTVSRFFYLAFFTFFMVSYSVDAAVQCAQSAYIALVLVFARDGE